MKKIIAMFVFVMLFATAGASSAEAFFGFGHNNGGDTNVKVVNDAYVKNVVNTYAGTGENSSEGGKAKSRASARGFWSDASSTANGGNGGEIDTGDAYADSLVENTVNSTDLEVEADCGCKGDLDVEVDNQGKVKNYVDTAAETGKNESEGGNAKSSARAKKGGDATSTSNGGAGGDIKTGDAESWSTEKNYVNKNIVRVTRGNAI